MSALFDVILPVFIVIGFGYVVAWRRMFTEIAVDGPWREISEELATNTSLRGVWEPPM